MIVKVVVVFVVVLAGVGGLIGANWTPDRSVASLKARWAQPPSAFVALDGMQVHVRDEGPANDPLPIVLVHGTGSSLQTWDGWAQRLRATHRVISFDRPGFGLTGPNPSGDYSMAYYTVFLQRLLDRMGVKDCVLAGNSSGGRVAWHAALAMPNRVRRLVLLAPAGYPRTTPLPLGLRIAMSPVLGPLLSHILPRGAVEKSLRGTYGDVSKVTPELVDRTYEIALRAGNRQALGETLRQAQATDDSAAIATVQTPTLIIWGDRDSVIPPVDAERFHSDIKGSTLVMLPGVGHTSQEEDPDGTVAALEKFLTGRA